MRKITSLLVLLLMFVFSFEASAYKVVYSSSDPDAGAFYREAPDVEGGWGIVTSGFTKRWVSYGTPRIIISMKYNNMRAQDFTFWSGSSKSDYTVRIDNLEYVMTKLTIRWSNLNTDGSHDQTIIMADGSENTAVGTGEAEVYADFSDEPARETTFGMGSSANSGAKILAFEIEYIDNELGGRDLLEYVLQQYEFDPAKFPIGDDPGFFPEEKVSAAEELFYACTDASADPSLSDEELGAIAKEYLAAWNDLLASQVPVVVTAGNFYMVSAREGFTNAVISDFLKDTDFTAAYSDGNYMRAGINFDPVQGDEANPLYMWALENATDSTFYIKSLAFNNYVQSVTSNAGKFTMTDDNAKRAQFKVITAQKEPGFVYLRNAAITGLGTMDDRAYIYCDTNEYTCNYNAANNVTYPLAWKFLPIDDETINSEVVQRKLKEYLDSVAQAKLFAELKTLYNQAVDAREAGRTFIFDGANDGSFPVGEGLVTSAEQVFSNAKEKSEGSYEGLFDGGFNGSSFFHSAWGTAAYGEVTEPHYLQMDLTKPVETLILKYAVRSNAGTPDVPYNVTVYGTNNAALLSHAIEDADTLMVPSTEWDSVMSLNFTYDYQIIDSLGNTVSIVIGSGTPAVKGAGIAKIEMPKAYQYVRVSVNTNVKQERDKNYKARVLDGYTYWYLSELRAYEGTYDPDCVYAHMDEAARTALENAIANALKEIKEGVATQETYDALKEAYDAYMAVYPDANTLNEAIAYYQSFADAAVEGEDPGFFEAGAKAALQAVIDGAKTALESTLTYTTYNNAMNALKDGYKAFSAKLVTPADGLYLIMSYSGASKDPSLDDDDPNKRPESSPYGSVIYTRTSSTRMDNNAGLRWGYADDTDLDYRTNAQWILTKLEDGSGFTLKNLFNGLYMSNKQTKASNYIHTSLEPDTIRLRYARYEGGFNLVLDEDETRFVNASPNSSHNGSIVMWGSAKADDNSIFVFVPTSYEGSLKLDVNGEVPTIFTMPVAVTCDEAYVVKGKKVGESSATIELEKHTGILAAGTPFVVYPQDAEVTEVEIEIVPTNAEDLNWIFEGKNEVNGLVGVIQPDTITAQYAVWGVDSVTAATRAAWQIIAANSGYFNIEGMSVTTEAGEASLPLSMRTVMGIETVAVEPEVFGRKAGIFNLQGVRLNSEKNLPKGVYIINGNKVVKK